MSALPEPITYGELFAGINGFGDAFKEEGFDCSWMVEINDKSRAVEEHHSPDVPKFRDVRECGKDNLARVDAILAGFPCQGFSVAGKREGLKHEGSNLFFEMIRIIHELQPTLVVWENVPGLLSSCSCRRCQRACQQCGSIVGADDKRCDACGSDELRGRVLPGHRGADIFAVVSTFRKIGFDGAWRILDSQYFGVAQRRRRLFGVFVNGNTGNPGGLVGAPSGEELRRLADLYSEILLERGGVQRGTQKGKGARQSTAASVKSSPPNRRNGGSDPIPGEFIVAGTLNAEAGRRTSGNNNKTDFLVADTITANYANNGGASAGGDGGLRNAIVTGSVSAKWSKGTGGPSGDEAQNLIAAEVLDVRNLRSGGQISGTLQSKKSGGYSLNYQNPIAFEWNRAAGSERTQIHRSGDYAQIRPNSVDAIVFNLTQITSKTNGSNPQPGDPSHALAATNHPPILDTSIGVRRLTPTECERLQGFSDGWTDIGQSDSARYQQLGNAVCRKVALFLARNVKRVWPMLSSINDEERAA